MLAEEGFTEWLVKLLEVLAEGLHGLRVDGHHILDLLLDIFQQELPFRQPGKLADIRVLAMPACPDVAKAGDNTRKVVT